MKALESEATLLRLDFGFWVGGHYKRTPVWEGGFCEDRVTGASGAEGFLHLWLQSQGSSPCVPDNASVDHLGWAGSWP